LNNLILYDGECGFCNESVKFILNRDQKQFFYFASLQSKLGQEQLKMYHLPLHDFSSFVFIHQNKVFLKSEAAIEVAKNLKYWKWVVVFKIVPQKIRDAVYDLIAKNRHKIFPQSECMLLKEHQKKQFLNGEK